MAISIEWKKGKPDQPPTTTRTNISNKNVISYNNCWIKTDTPLHITFIDEWSIKLSNYLINKITQSNADKNIDGVPNIHYRLDKINLQNKSINTFASKYFSSPVGRLGDNILQYIDDNNSKYYDPNRYPNLPDDPYSEKNRLQFTQEANFNTKRYNLGLGLGYNSPSATGHINGNVYNGGYSLGGNASFPNIFGSPSFGFKYHNGQKRPDFDGKIYNLFGPLKLFGQAHIGQRDFSTALGVNADF
ncbi:hypothetical protein [Zymomonas mobilis]|uniref:hypothetical protein n=1 Tax=Zymomonas mobilis TaxID=542 RepID=UPI0021C34EE5|nr:hypothetical protein [Zymomonas mobilis]MCP9306987.1 hypothetical protein [Zymomonas mobilis]